MRLQFAAVGLDELAEGLAIAGPGPGEGCLDRAVILPPDRLATASRRCNTSGGADSSANHRPGRCFHQ